MANNTDWLNISQMTGGTGETALSLTALTNTSLEPKTATITARNSQYNVSDTTTVTIQGFVPTLTLSRSTLRFDSTGGTATFTVYSNTAWTINFPAIVQSYSVSAGTGDTEVSVVLAPNPDEVAKVDTGIVKDVYNVNQLYLTIVQESFIAELYVEPTDDIIFANTGSSTAITIETNADWELVYPSWVIPSIISGESGTSIVVLTAERNGNTNRNGAVTVYAGSKYVTINVSQPFYIEPYITVTPSSYTFDYVASSTQFVVNSYPGWSAEVISTGETHWGEDIALTVTLEVESDNLTVSDLGQTGCIVNGVVASGNSYTFNTRGTYTILYPFTGETLSGMGTIPNYNAITTTSIVIGEHITTIPINCFYGEKITAITIPSGITSIGDGAFSCPNLTTIYAEPVVAPAITSSTFRDIAKNGTLHYPYGSDYSSWLSLESEYLGFHNWNNVLFDNLHIATIVYNVTSTTDPTKIFSNANDIYAVKDEQGNVHYISDWSDTSYTFTVTGKQSLDVYFKPFTSDRKQLYLDQVLSMTDLTINELHCLSGNQYVELIANNNGYVLPNLSSLTLNQQVSKASGYLLYGVKYYTVGGNVNSPIYPRTESRYNENLEEVVFNSTGVTTLPENAFKNCANLKTITLPPSLTSIGNYAFSGCSSLEEINIYAETAPSLSSYVFSEIKYGGTLHYFDGADYSSWLSNSYYHLGYYNWNGAGDLISSYLIVTPNTINASVLSLSYTFKVFSPSRWTLSATDVSWLSFSQTSGDRGGSTISVSVDENFIYGGVVPERTSIVTITNGIETQNLSIIQDGGKIIVAEYMVTSTTETMTVAKNGDRDLVKAYRSDGTSVATVGVLSGNVTTTFPTTGLNSVYFYSKADDTECGSIFNGVTALTGAKISGGFESFRNTFRSATSLTGVTIGYGTLSLTYCFRDCTRLARVTLPETIVTIASSFTGCISLQRIVIPAGVASLGWEFSGCTSLSSVTFEGPTSLTGGAFSGCTSLTEIRCFSRMPAELYGEAFRNVSTGGTLYYPYGSDYSSWLSTNEYYLGYYGWTGSDELLGFQPDTIIADESGETSSFELYSPSEWHITGGDSWVSLSQNSGAAGYHQINVTIEENPISGQSRSCYLIITDGSSMGSIGIRQGNPTLPDVPFLCNYNAKDIIIEGNNKTFPQTEGQSFASDIVLTGNITANTNSGFVHIAGSKSNQQSFTWTYAASNPFNRYNTSTGRTFTAIYKTSSFSNSIVGNRSNTGGTDNYNYMLRNTTFHTSDDILSLTPSVSPYIIYVRVNEDGTCERKCVSTGQVVTGSSITYGNASRGIAFFAGMTDGALSEYYTGDFYWLYISNEALTDEEIQRVIDYNELK